MSKTAFLKVLCAISFAFTLLAIPAGAQAQKEDAPAAGNKATLDNLMEAFAGESNANARYLAFAGKADEEGYGRVASLFRAAARAEQVHFEWHSKIIKELGGNPVTNVAVPEVKTTKENLEASVRGEKYESKIMYPQFLSQAQKDGAAEAVDAFEDAAAAEAVHAVWYEKALSNLEAWKTPNSDFYVCPVCGNVVDDITVKECPICMTPSGKFITVK